MDRDLFKVEVCANSYQSCLAARQGGAGRVELCASMSEGGTTPSYGTICKARDIEGLRLHVLIRPRGSDFHYTSEEIDIMMKDISMCQSLGVDGVVFGVLRTDGQVDKETMKRLMDASKGMSVTFHRAFDHCRNPFQALDDIVELGCHRILTSGQQPSAIKGTNLLRQLVEAAAGRIQIMPGCGLNAGNIAQIAQATGAREFHFSARRQVESQMEFRYQGVCMGMACNEFVREETDCQQVKAAIEALLALPL
ncbi:MAG: copper homeostasis protein CutC [Bacteroidetes bacterium]|uniref:PF03932 family protein CutC n=1 Tax=Candidatus Gallipaludibacter merdavium TaxID=2840839 RepID=A0A9D9HWA5_9BACT|nr:copper homeostasis protein CutC [Candidatus Gallipaludibacter merdavium]